MAETKFKYNLKTLRYERTSISILGLSFRVFGYLTVGSLFFIGLVVLQNYVIETPLEKSLRAENEALHKHKIVLTANLQESNNQIGELKKEDQLLYEKLFETKLVVLPTLNIDKEEILAAEPELFSDWEATTNKQLTALSQKAKNSNIAFGRSASIGKADLKTLNRLPTSAPVKSFEFDKLVSGFGKRINPFHKGLYHHDGVDIAMPTGTAVLASASGIIILSRQSNLLAGFGNYIEIDHGNGIITRYAHLEVLKGRFGQKVNKGEVIGTIGTSGGSIAPHLHYEVSKKGKNTNPVYYIIGGLSSDQFQAMLDNSKKENQSLD